jgi:hypothetical protein
MVYNPAIPQPADLISNSQPQILANFTAIDTGVTGTGIGFTVNHITMADPSYPGMHDLIEMPLVQSADPTSTGANFSAIYSKTGSTNAEPFFLNNASALGSVLWYGGTGNGGVTATISGNGWLNLPNGLKFRWGSFVAGTSGTGVSFSSAFTTCFSLSLTANTNNARSSSFTNLTASGFTGWAQNNGTTLYYIAVGN